MGAETNLVKELIKTNKLLTLLDADLEPADIKALKDYLLQIVNILNGMGTGGNLDNHNADIEAHEPIRTTIDDHIADSDAHSGAAAVESHDNNPTAHGNNYVTKAGGQTLTGHKIFSAGLSATHISSPDGTGAYLYGKTKMDRATVTIAPDADNEVPNAGWVKALISEAKVQARGRLLHIWLQYAQNILNIDAPEYSDFKPLRAGDYIIVLADSTNGGGRTTIYTYDGSVSSPGVMSCTINSIGGLIFNDLHEHNISINSHPPIRDTITNHINDTTAHSGSAAVDTHNADPNAHDTIISDLVTLNTDQAINGNKAFNGGLSTYMNPTMDADIPNRGWIVGATRGRLLQVWEYDDPEIYELSSYRAFRITPKNGDFFIVIHDSRYNNATTLYIVNSNEGSNNTLILNDPPYILSTPIDSHNTDIAAHTDIRDVINSISGRLLYVWPAYDAINTLNPNSEIYTRHNPPMKRGDYFIVLADSTHDYATMLYILDYVGSDNIMHCQEYTLSKTIGFHSGSQINGGGTTISGNTTDFVVYANNENYARYVSLTMYYTVTEDYQTSTVFKLGSSRQSIPIYRIDDQLHSANGATLALCKTLAVLVPPNQAIYADQSTSSSMPSYISVSVNWDEYEAVPYDY